MLKKQQFINLICQSNFHELFITELGWNRYRGQSSLPQITIDDVDFNIESIAILKGFQILVCKVDEIPSQSLARKIDTKLRRQAADYICIYQLRNTSHHMWVVPVRTNEKRELVLIEYEDADKADFLYSKIEGFSFEFGEETNIVDIRAKVQGAFAVNSEKITKDFYAGFKKQHKAFANFITGIDDETDTESNRNKQWYASVMLNRLMFCYFIQKKGFLNLDHDYLRHKLQWVQQEQGENRFFQSFYRGFLTRLFHGGLNTPHHNRDFESIYGKIPYLNGGMFDEHQLEKDYADIDIKDEAFVSLFDFFDTWRWHLDTRITASGKDINPDVLGYIFEQYINDRAQMGAYYTKEDITEYIGKNCIIPFLLDKVAVSSPAEFKPDGYAWCTLRESGDRYIYDAVKKGYSVDWEKRIPADIACGLDTTKPNLLVRRAQWNTKTADEFALPTEIWRETIERLTRCESILRKIQSGEITHINDFITYNLDIRLFVADLLERTENNAFLKQFYHALQNVTILDPTCGSGAFLFAAMNILEPLYEICINRMQEFHTCNQALFKEELREIENKYRSNIQYFIFKSIILRNLYGVDIMVEATEIAKLRLFLKMVAVVEVDRRADNLGLDPLPDIDFNIRCGNTLVGYANAEELNNDLTYGDMFANQEFCEKIKTELDKVATAFAAFKEVQFTQSEDMVAFKTAKTTLKERLASLNEQLDCRLHQATTTNIDIAEWRKSHQPFHWFAEFYEIIQGNGGFDVIIGNPPYVSMSEIKYLENSETFKCSDLYGHVIKRVFTLMNKRSRHGFIVMHNLAFSRNFTDTRKAILSNTKSVWFSFYSRIPSGLFDGSVRVRNAIYLTSNTEGSSYSTRLHRWFSEQRDTLFQIIKYNHCIVSDAVPMVNDETLQKLYDNKTGQSFINAFGSILYVKGTAYNCLSVTPICPPTYGTDGSQIDSCLNTISVKSELKSAINLLLAGKFMFTRWLTYGDDFHLMTNSLTDFKYPWDSISDSDIKVLKILYDEFLSQLDSTLSFKLNAGKKVGTFNIRHLWNITDKSDLIFLKYISNDPEKAFEYVENYVAASVISDKKDYDE